ncbi:hypothetical protein AB0D59_12385 [Streptomyces sp. NPDC048417]|uniref:hypothetical protein n=1 Tax=Streptomyces sp. NPDC048417 TaxID=3155387 RepID=UPI003439F3EE
MFGTVGSATKTQLAAELGYDALFVREDFEDAVREATAGRGVDLVLDPVGGPVRHAGLRSRGAERAEPGGAFPRRTGERGAGAGPLRRGRRVQPACCCSSAERWVRGGRRPRCSRSVLPVYPVR